MDTGIIILGIADAAGRIPGRTVLQKLVYFACERFKVDAHFTPHFFGPYSGEVDVLRDSFLASNFLTQKVESGTLATPIQSPSGYINKDWSRFTFELSLEGKQYLEANKAQLGARAELLKRIVSYLQEKTALDTTKISNAAKVHYIMEHEGIKSAAQIAARCQRYGWRLGPEAIQKAHTTVERLPA